MPGNSSLQHCQNVVLIFESSWMQNIPHKPEKKVLILRSESGEKNWGLLWIDQGRGYGDGREGGQLREYVAGEVLFLGDFHW